LRQSKFIFGRGLRGGKNFTPHKEGDDANSEARRDESGRWGLKGGVSEQNLKFDATLDLKITTEINALCKSYNGLQKGENFEGRKDILAPVFFIGGIAPLLAPRIDATVYKNAH